MNRFKFLTPLLLLLPLGLSLASFTGCEPRWRHDDRIVVDNHRDDHRIDRRHHNDRRRRGDNDAPQVDRSLVERIRVAFGDTPEGRQACRDFGAMYMVLGEQVAAGKYDYDEGIEQSIKGMRRLLGYRQGQYEAFSAIVTEVIDPLLSNDVLTEAKKQAWHDTLCKLGEACRLAAGGANPESKPPPAATDPLLIPAAAAVEAKAQAAPVYQGKLGGWNPNLEDKAWLRSHKPMGFMAGPEPHEDIDPSDVIPIWDQQQQGSCAGHARTYVLEELNYWTNGNLVPLNRQFAYITAQMIDGSVGTDSGSTISGNMKATEKWGICPESAWEYTGQYNTRIPKQCWDEAAKHKLLEFADCRSYERTRDFVGRKVGGVQIGIGWAGCKIVDGYKIEDYTPGMGGGHSVCILGVLWKSMRDDKGDPYLLGPNSWGTRFGKKGWFVVSPKAYRKMMADPFCEALGASKMQIFRKDRLDPRSFSDASFDNDADSLLLLAGLRQLDKSPGLPFLVPGRIGGQAGPLGLGRNGARAGDWGVSRRRGFESRSSAI